MLKCCLLSFLTSSLSVNMNSRSSERDQFSSVSALVVWRQDLTFPSLHPVLWLPIQTRHSSTTKPNLTCWLHVALQQRRLTWTEKNTGYLLGHSLHTVVQLVYHVTQLQSSVWAEVVEVTVLSHALVETPQRVLPGHQEAQDHLRQLLSLWTKMRGHLTWVVTCCCYFNQTEFVWRMDKLMYRHLLSVFLAVWGENGGSVTVASDSVNLIPTAQEVVFLGGQTWTQEGNVKG